MMWGFPKIGGTLFGGPFSKDATIKGCYIRVPYFRKLPCGVVRCLLGSESLYWYPFTVLYLFYYDIIGVRKSE